MNDDESAAFNADSSCWSNLCGEPLQDRERVNYWSATHQKHIACRDKFLMTPGEMLGLLLRLPSARTCDPT